MSEVKLMCPVCGGEMRNSHTVGLSFDIEDDPQGAFYTEWFAEMWDCPKGCCYAEDWWYDDEHRDFFEGATRNKQTYWYHPDTQKEIKRDIEQMVREMGPG